MGKSNYPLIRAKHILYFLFFLVCLAFCPAGPDSGLAAEQSQSETFISHVATFKSTVNAEKYLKLLESKGLKSWTNKINVPEKGEFYRVYVGSFDSRESAVKAMRILKRKRVISDFAIEMKSAAPREKGETLPKTEEVKNLPPESKSLQKDPTFTSKPAAPKSPEPSLRAKHVNKATTPSLAAASLTPKTRKKISTRLDGFGNRPLYHDRDASFYYNHGMKFLVKAQYDKALLSFSNAIRVNAKFAEGYIKRGDTWYLKGDNKMAINDYNTAIALKPNYSESYLGRGLAYKKLGQIKNSEEDLRHACKLCSEEACTLLNVWPKSSTLHHIKAPAAGRF